MDQKMILKFIFLFLTFSIEKSVSFKNELDSSIPHDEETKSLSIKCGLECIFKCLTGNANVIDYECLHVCLPNCTDSSKDVFKDMSKTKGQTNEDLGQLTIVQLCNLPYNSDEKQVAEVVCDFCKEVSSAFLEVYGNFTIHYGCTEIDPCPDPGKNTESSIQKWCKFCTAIKDWINPNQPTIGSKDQIKELDTKVKQMPDTSTALQATIGQICTKPCNHDKEDVCDFCSTFPNMYSMTLKQACYDDDNNL